MKEFSVRRFIGQAILSGLWLTVILLQVHGQSTIPNWEFYRGAAFDGKSSETGLVDSWPSEGPPVLWVRDLGQGYSSFVGRGNRVFTSYQTLTSQFVVCLDASTGDTLWKHAYDWSYQTAGLYPGPRSTPTLDGERIYFTSPKGVLRCLRQDDGELIWEVDLPRKFDAPPVAFGYACSPVIVGGKIFLPVGGAKSAVVAIDKQNGETIWNSGDAEISYASILPIVRNGRDLLVAYLQNELWLLRQSDGELLCRLNLSQGYDEHSAWPIYQEPYLWISAPFRNGSRLLEVADSPSFEFKPVWQNDLLSNDVCSSTLVGKHLYGFDIFDVQSKIHRPSRGSYRCLEFSTGRSCWQQGEPRARISTNNRSPFENEITGHCSTIYADGKLILFNDMGDVILARADPERFVELARASVLPGQICWTQPMLLNRRLYLRNHSQAVCVYLGEPDELELSEVLPIAVADMPKRQGFDWAGLVFSVEPEYAMDAPTTDWLVNWFWVMLISGWGVAFPIALLVARVFHCGQSSRRFLFRALACTLAIVGTTVFSRWLNVFIFTWPLALAITFEWLFFQTKSRKQLKQTKSGESVSRFELWHGRIALLVFVVVCVGYFLACRRLSLAFEWSFLLGFPAAIPFLWIARQTGTGDLSGSFKSTILEWIFTALAFAAFFGVGAVVIALKY